jgi:hypothetical protein
MFTYIQSTFTDRSRQKWTEHILSMTVHMKEEIFGDPVNIGLKPGYLRNSSNEEI